MRKCQHCGRSAPDEAAFCPGCGKHLNLLGAPPRSGSGAVIAIAAGAGLLVIVMFIGIVAAIAIPNLLSAIQRGKQKRSMGEIRSIATAVQAYATDNKLFPRPEEVPDEGWRFYPVEKLAPLLEPDYIRAIPRPDPWNGSYLYGVTGDGQHFCVIGTGKDGAREERDLEAPPATTSCFENDLIWLDDQFLQRPEGRQRVCGGAN